ncbi:MAG TPA: GNAT family N-acetyltransferase [Polyangiaceae bacterium]|nr:GNAT family N-acetyltransferase [Polyangiaceae bacterium]
MLIRDLSPDDCDALEPLRAEPSLNIDPRVELSKPLVRAWVACDAADGAPLGYVLGWWLVDELEIHAVGVLPSARRRGVARRLLEHAMASARTHGGRRLLLEVARSNSAARRLYESLGFVVFNVRRGYYRATGDDALEMERLLEQPSA